MALSAKRRAFIDHYLETWNASEAARRAGYSKKTAGSIGHENLNIPEIKQEIERRVAERTMGADEALILLAQQARGSMGDFVRIDDDGQPYFDLKRAKQAKKLGLIRKLKMRSRMITGDDGPEITEVDVELELYNRQTALDMIGKAHGIFRDRVDHTVHGDLNIHADDLVEATRELDEWQQQSSDE